MLPTDRTMTVLRLTVRNHPGMLLHVVGLLARRAYRTAGLVYRPHGATGTLLVQIDEPDRMRQVMAQLGRLEDVLEVE